MPIHSRDLGNHVHSLPLAPDRAADRADVGRPRGGDCTEPGRRSRAIIPWNQDGPMTVIPDDFRNGDICRKGQVPRSYGPEAIARVEG